jgi:pimeloyl-ACP methyl ester carboxylesterase
MGTVNGAYEPLFEGTGGFASLSGGAFAIASGGGLVAATAGTTAVGIINLPKIVNGSTMPWRFAALVYFGGDTTHSTSVQIQNPNDTSWGVFNFTINNGLSTGVGGNGQMTLQSNLTAGQYFWFTAASDGNQVVTAIIPKGHAGIAYNPTYASTVLQEAYETYTATYATSGHTPAFTGMGQIKISTASTQNVVLGVFFNAGALTGGPDPRMQPPAIVPVSITRPDGTVDTTALVFLPEAFHDAAPGQPQFMCNAIHVDHPNGSDERTGLRLSDPDTGTAFAYLRSQGFIMSLIRGDESSYTSNYASPWGGANGLAVRQQLIAWMRTNLPYMNNLYWIGQSMGGLDGLNYELQYPGSLAGYVGISAVANMTAAYNGSNSGENFASTIEGAYPSYYVSLQNSNTGNALSNTTWWQQVTLPGGLLQSPYAGYTNEGAYSSGTTYAANQVVYSNATAMSQLADHDPTLRPGAFVNLPMEFWHTTGDTLIPLAQLQAFQTAVQGAGGNFTINTSTGNHLGNAAEWNGPGIAALFGNPLVQEPVALSTSIGGGI